MKRPSFNWYEFATTALGIPIVYGTLIVIVALVLAAVACGRCCA